MISDETNAVTRNRTNKFNRKKKFAKNWKRTPKVFAHDSTTGMKGATEELDSSIFSVSSEMKGMRQDQFGVAIDHAKDYVNKKCKNPQDLSGCLNYVELFMPKP